MVRNILEKMTAPVRSIARPISGLHQAAYVLAGLTLASQMLALVRDRIFATSFGAGETLDLYYAAFKVPDFVFALVASLVSAYVLIPLIAGSTKKESRALLSQTTSFLLIGGGLVCAVLWVYMPQLLAGLYPNLTDARDFDSFVFLAQLLLLQPLLLGLSSILTSVTQLNRKFFLYALSPVLYNLGIIAGTVFLYPLYGLVGVGMGVIVGAFLHLALHIPATIQAGLFPSLTLPSPKTLVPIVMNSVPRSLALSMGAVTTLGLTALAAMAGDGGISVFTLASNLQAVPLSLIAASYATAAFPVMAKQIGDGDREAFVRTFVTASRHLIFWSSVVLVLTIVLRAHVVRVIYGAGAFDWNDTRLTAAVLALLITSLVAQGFVLLASRAFYAAGKSWNPLLIQVFGGVLSIAAAVITLAASYTYPEFRYFIEALFRVEDVGGVSILFIAIGAAVGQLGMGVLAAVTLRSVAPGVVSQLGRPLAEGLSAGIMGGAAAYGVLSYLGNLAPLTTLLVVFTEGALAGMVGLAVSAAVLVLLENREFRDLCTSLRKVRGVSRFVPPHGSESADQQQ